MSLLLLLKGAAAPATATTWVDTVLADSPNIFYRMDETSGNLTDSSGHAQTGTANGTITYQTASMLTDLNRAVTLDGTTAYITAADGTYTDLGDVFTLEAIVNIAQFGIGATSTIFSKGTGAYLLDIGAGGAIRLQKHGAGTLVSSTTNLSAGRYHHIVVTKNGSAVKIWLDGVDVTGTVTNQTMTDNATALNIGRNAVGLGSFLRGGLDEVAVYPTALSPTRVAAHYAALTYGATFVTLSANLPDVALSWSPTTAPNATPVWEDLLATSGSLFARSIALRRGRNDEFSRFETATLSTTLDNRARDFDPNYTGGRWYPNVKPMRRIRLLARWPQGAGGSVYSRFVGFTGDEIPQSYPSVGADAVVPLTAYDGFGVLAMAKLPTTFSRPAELSGARIAAVLDQVGWPAADRSISTGVAILDAYTASTDTSALSHLMDVQDAEGGALFVDRAGNVVFQDRHYRNLSERTSRQTFCTDATGETGLKYKDVDVRYGGRLWNGAQITPSSGTVQEWSDTTSQADYYPRVFTRSLPLSSDADALALAQYVVQFNKAPSLRCYSMTVTPALAGTTMWPATLDLEISHHVTVRVTPPAETGTYSFEQSIEGCEETISPSSWTVKFPMSPADLTTYWVLGTATLGVDTVLAY